MLTVIQIRAARAMVGMSQKDLAAKAGISIATLNNIERGAQVDPKVSTMQALQQCLEASGIEFIFGPLGRVGVAWKPRQEHAGEATILIIDDNKADRTLYKNWLSKAPGKRYRILEAENASAGMDAFLEHQPACIILDFMMYGTDGFQLLAALKREKTTLPPIIFVTGMHNAVMEENAKSEGVHTYLNKQQLRKEDLLKAVAHALRH